MKWDYLVEDVYESYQFVPVDVPIGRIMTDREQASWSRNIRSWMKSQEYPKNRFAELTFAMFLQQRGQQGWELVQATRIPASNPGGLEYYDPFYWRVILNAPVQVLNRDAHYHSLTSRCKRGKDFQTNRDGILAAELLA